MRRDPKFSHNHYCRPRLCRAPWTLGKGFAERGARQRAPGKETLGKGSFAERHKGLRQRKATGMTVMHRDIFFAECLHSALGKEQNIFFFENFFAERLQDNARQRGNQFF